MFRYYLFVATYVPLLRSQFEVTKHSVFADPKYELLTKIVQRLQCHSMFFVHGPKSWSRKKMSYGNT